MHYPSKITCLESPATLSAGEHWDTSEESETLYNPVPHFTYHMALDHSAALKSVATLPRGALDALEEGIGSL